MFVKRLIYHMAVECHLFHTLVNDTITHINVGSHTFYRVVKYHTSPKVIKSQTYHRTIERNTLHTVVGLYDSNTSLENHTYNTAVVKHPTFHRSLVSRTSDMIVKVLLFTQLLTSTFLLWSILNFPMAVKHYTSHAVVKSNTYHTNVKHHHDEFKKSIVLDRIKKGQLCRRIYFAPSH